MRLLKLILSLLSGATFLCPVFAQVSADFTSSTNSGCGSLQVSFTDISFSTTGNIVSWDWDLGGVGSVNQNPGRIFGVPGNYTICLTVTDNNGNSDTECKENFITVFNLPNPQFSSDTQIACIPAEVSFIDESTSIDGNIVEWVWGLGGVSGVVIDNGSNPIVSNVYENPDTFTISLTVIDDNGCINSLTETDYLTVFDYPNIDISLSDTFSCTPPLIISATNNNIEPNVNYYWDVGNGFPIYEGNTPPTIFYSDEGIYSFTVIAENILTGCSDTLVLEDIINVGDAVDFSYSIQEGCEDLSIAFFNNSVSWATDISWDFGDGNFSEEHSPNHIYTEPGCYFVTLTSLVGDCVDSHTIETCIEVWPRPDINFTNDNPIGCTIPHEVSFEAFSNTQVSYSWSFGDGASSEIPNPTHTYSTFGLFPILLEVTDMNGCTNSFLDTIEIQPLIAQMDFGFLSGCSPVEFTIEDNSSSISPIDSWYWIVDTSFSNPSFPLFTSTAQMPSFSIVDTGWYDISLIVTNTLGCIDTIVNPTSINVGIPSIVDFSASPLIVCVDEPIQFMDLSEGAGESWYWDFGDGTFSSEQNPIHAYTNAPDTFDVTLSVIHNGCESTFVIEDYIVTVLPLASFSLERDCAEPYVISFIDNSVGADSIIWDFGYEGTTDTSTLLNPVVTYPDVGCYTATQIVFNFTTNCIDSALLDFCITEPVADFTLSPLSGCSPLNVEVSNNSEFDIAWHWTAPGAIFSNNGFESPTITYADPGLYSDVQLIITDMNNCQDTLIFTDTIFVDGVTVDFESLPSGGCAPLSVLFFDNSSSFLSSIQSWDWEIGNGLASSTEMNTGYLFNFPGSYPVSLRVTNEWGCESTLNVPDAINVSTISASFSADTISCPLDSIPFENLSIGENLTYNWDFGDGNNSNEENPIHQFENEGDYNVCLRINDFAGCIQEFCQSINIVTPVADFMVDTTYANCPPLLVSFQNGSQNNLYNEWTFGDNSGLSDLENPQHIYTIPGSYDVQLVASINESCTDTLLIPDLIQVEGPVGGFFFFNDTACISDPVTFIGNSLDSFTYIWDYGDGTLDTTFNVTNDTVFYAFQEAGIYIPSLTLINSENCFRTIVSPDTIFIGLLDINFAASDTALCDGETAVQFINLINSSAPITDLIWSFENGSPQISNDLEPLVTFAGSGNHDVTLIAENAYCRDTLIKEDYIGVGASPLAAFSASSFSGCVPFHVDFFDQSTPSNGLITNWSWDFGGLGNSSAQNPSFVFNTTGIIEISLLVTTEFGCIDTLAYDITIHGPAEPIFSLSEPEICIGDNVQIGVTLPIDTTGLTYYWEADPTLTCLDCLNPFANPISTTSYFFISTTNQGCVDTSEVIVEVLPYAIPDISLTADTFLCINESVQLNAFAGATDIFEWDQNASGLSCYLNCMDPIASPSESTLYTLTVTNAFGCDAVDSVLVDVVDQNIPFAGVDRTICEGDSVQLNLLFDGIPIWLNSSSLTCADCIDPLAFPLTTTSYIVQNTTADFGCFVMDTIIVNVFHPDDLDAGDDFQICLGESVLLNASTNSTGTVIWTPSMGLDNHLILNPISSPMDTTLYILMVEEDLCTLIDSTEIIVQYLTEVESFDYYICQGDTVQINYIGEADNIEWTPSETLSDGFENSPLAFPSETTQYTLTANLSTCEGDTAIATVFVSQGPELLMPMAYDKFPGIDVQIELEVLSGSGNYSYEWLRFDGLSCNDCPNPVLSIDTSGYYTVVVYDESNDCSTEQRVFINLLRRCNPDLISVPNLFTPNDDGLNDKTEILSAAIPEIYIFRIYNRWGALLFETRDIYEGWDGRFRNNPMPSGAYVYYLEAPCPIDGTTLLKKGSITLLR